MDSDDKVTVKPHGFDISNYFNFEEIAFCHLGVD